MPLLQRLSPAFVSVLLASALVGCGQRDAADRHFAELRDQISKIQADQDKTDHRLNTLEVAVAEEKTGRLVEGQQPELPSKKVAPTEKRVVALGPGETESDDPNDPSARPEIRLVGPAGAASRPSRGKTRADEPLPTVRGDAGSLRDRASALDPDAKRAYETALANVQAKHYDKGLEGLTAFLVRWPDHPYAENATYWRGEALYAKGEILRAAEQFEAVLARFAMTGAKAPDALLKLGMCQERLGAHDRATEYFNRLRAEYPRSEAVKRIPATAVSPDRKGPKESR